MSSFSGAPERAFQERFQSQRDVDRFRLGRSVQPGRSLRHLSLEGLGQEANAASGVEGLGHRLGRGAAPQGKPGRSERWGMIEVGCLDRTGVAQDVGVAIIGGGEAARDLRQRTAGE